MWTYEQATGRVSRDGMQIAVGYSGYCKGKNNPEYESMENIGPIPRGHYRITEPIPRGHYRITEPYDSAQTGPYSLPLIVTTPPLIKRYGFRIHGDSIKDPGNASHGCIILNRPTRALIWKSGDHELQVV